MSRQSVVSFRSYVFVHGREPRLRTHSRELTITHFSYDDMVLQIRCYIDTKLNIPGDLKIQSYPNGEEITREFYENLPRKGKICVTIDLGEEVGMGHGITTKSTHQDLMVSLEHLQRKLERLERSLLTR